MGIIQRQGIKNAIISYVGILLGAISLLIIQPHYLKPEEIGLTRVLFSFSYLLASFAGLGIGNITIRYFPYFKNYDKGHHGFLGFVLLFPLLGTLITALLIWFFANPFQALYAEKSELFNTYYFFSIPFAFFIALFIALTNYCYALFKTTVPSLLNDVIQRVLFIGLVLTYSFNLISLDVFIGAYIGIYGLLFLGLFMYLMKEDRFSFKMSGALWSKNMLRAMLAFGFVFLLAGLASMSIKLIDSVVLGQFLALDMVGVYAIAAFIPTFIEAPGNALDKIAAPKIADNLVKKDFNEISNIYKLSSRYLFAVGALLFLLVNLNIVDLLSFLPEIYQNGAQAVKILSLSALFNLVTGTNNALVFNSDRFYLGVAVLLTIALLAVWMLYLFIPIAGIEGAAWAICLSSIFYNGFKFAFIWFKYKIQPFGAYTIVTLLIFTVTYILGYFLPLNFGSFLNIILRSSTIAGVFIASCLYFGVIDKKGLNIFKK